MSAFLERQNETLARRLASLEAQFEEIKRAIEENMQTLIDEGDVKNLPKTRHSIYAHMVDVLGHMAKEQHYDSNDQTNRPGTLQ